jgi:type IV pilus modification protein PilV
MIRLKSIGHRSSGFSLLEVLIAVVILAAGLLALASLQGSLTRSSAEAKVRARVAAMLSARMEDLRSNGYEALVDGTITTTSTTDACNDGDATDWIDCTRVQAGLGSLTSVQTVVSWSGTSSFTAAVPADPNEAQFRRVSLSAAWGDSSAGNHQLLIASDISPLGLSNSLIPPTEDEDSGGGGPIVRTTNPATAGVIPIALGNGDSTAASNPRPEVLSKGSKTSVVGTTFNVLTYSPSGSSAIIQKRFENQLIKCSCQYGAGSSLPEIYQTAQWPAIWTGDRYELYKTSPITAAPGQSLTPRSGAPGAGTTQSALCQECCRDHHQTTTTGVAQFDPERNDTHIKYDENTSTGALVPRDSTASGVTYVDACRVIRVDGFWRTAADTYARHAGLLATTTVGSKLAKTGVPNSTAVANYQNFVKGYLAQYVSSQTDPDNADALLVSNYPALNNPDLIDIDMPMPLDERFLHIRGLYVDYLEQAARSKITAVLADNGTSGRCPSGSDQTECILPYLPFTTINVTELAFWKPEKEDATKDTTILTVATGSSLDCGSADPPICDPAQPARGRTTAIKKTANAGLTSYAAAAIGKSNAGLASSSGIDTQDQAVRTDRQKFVVNSTSGAGNGDQFQLRLATLPQISDQNTANDPAAYWSVDSSADACLATINGDPSAGTIDYNPNNYICNTYSTLGAIGGSITLSSYYREYFVSKSMSATCTGASGAQSATGIVDVPTFEDYAVSSAVIGATAATGTPPYTVANAGKKTETTTIAFSIIPSGGIVDVAFGSPTLLEATIASCTTVDGTQINSITWTKSWE